MGSVLAAIALLLCFGIGMLLGKIKRPVPLEMAQREYVTIVLPRLVALYGPADDYTPARVDRALRETGADFAHRAYAYALFCSSADFARMRVCRGMDYHHARVCMLMLRSELTEIPWAGGTVPFDSKIALASRDLP